MPSAVLGALVYVCQKHRRQVADFVRWAERPQHPGECFHALRVPDLTAAMATKRNLDLAHAVITGELSAPRGWVRGGLPARVEAAGRSAQGDRGGAARDHRARAGPARGARAPDAEPDWTVTREIREFACGLPARAARCAVFGMILNGADEPQGSVGDRRRVLRRGRWRDPWNAHLQRELQGQANLADRAQRVVGAVASGAGWRDRYRDPRVQLLRRVPRARGVRRHAPSMELAAGIVDEASYGIETVKKIRDRAADWARVVGEERLWISPSCGFGRHPARSRQVLNAKMEHMVEAARRSERRRGPDSAASANSARGFGAAARAACNERSHGAGPARALKESSPDEVAGSPYADRRQLDHGRRSGSVVLLSEGATRAARKRCPSRLLRAKSGSVDGRIRPGESAQLREKRSQRAAERPGCCSPDARCRLRSGPGGLRA